MKVIRYEPRPGELVKETALTMTLLLASSKVLDAVKAKFNGIELTATLDTSANDIVAYYHEELKRQAEAYSNSPEGKKAAHESEERRVKMQEKHDALMRKLPDLNFADDVAILDWLCEFQNPSDYCDVVKQQEVVLAIFADHGYLPNVNTGESFKENDRDNFARYIIGQALDGLQSEVGAILGVIHKFVEDWKKKFLTPNT